MKSCQKSGIPDAERQPRRIGILAFDGVQLLDVAGPADVFAEANSRAARPLYAVEIVAPVAGQLRASSGMRIVPDRVLGSADDLRFDTFLVAGGPSLHRRARNPVLLDQIASIAHTARRFGSVCAGAFLLADAGLLEGKRVTTHWAVAELFRRRYPGVQLEEDAIFLRDGCLRTAAGVTAGLDLALALVREDHDAALARAVADQLVMYFRRGGGQLQFSRKGAAEPNGRSSLQEVQRYVIAHPAEPHSVAAMAARAGVSPRHFARLFRAETGMTPAAFVERTRLDAARDSMDLGAAPKAAAAHSGFTTPEAFRLAFRRRFGMTPAAYRKHHSPD